MKRAIRSFPAIFAAAALALAAPAAPRAEDRSAEIQGFTEALRSGNVEARITALKKITNSGITDRSLFDSINARLLEGYRVDPASDKGVDEVSWMCKALSSSGLADYKETLAKVAADAPSEKVRNYAKQSHDLVDRNAERNALLAKPSAETEGLAPEVARLVNMLRAPDEKLQRDAAKVITRSSFKEPRLYAVVKEELLAGAKEGSPGPDRVDTLAWLCKALAASGDQAYRPALQEVYDGTRDEKLRKYAKQSLDTLR